MRNPGQLLSNLLSWLTISYLAFALGRAKDDSIAIADYCMLLEDRVAELRTTVRDLQHRADAMECVAELLVMHTAKPGVHIDLPFKKAVSPK